MADFVPLVEETHWPIIPGPHFIQNKTSPVTFIQDITGTDAVNRKVADNEGGAPGDRYTQDAQSQVLPDSLKWPITAWKEQQPLPFVTAGAVAFLLVPAWNPGAGIGETVVLAYFAAAAEYFLQVYSKPPPVPKTQVLISQTPTKGK